MRSICCRNPDGDNCDKEKERERRASTQSRGSIECVAVLQITSIVCTQPDRQLDGSVYPHLGADCISPSVAQSYADCISPSVVPSLDDCISHSQRRSLSDCISHSQRRSLGRDCISLLSLSSNCISPSLGPSLSRHFISYKLHCVERH